ncbi:MAG: RHS repeat domain-containing protein [Pseudomonadota bacterium]
MKRSIRLFLLTALALLSPAAPAAERVTYFVPDALGSPVAAMDEQGAVLWRENYAPYGERRTKAPANDAKPAYTGKPEDPETGLVYMGARMYDPETARFAGIDPQGFSEGNPQSFGRYLYANNNPYLYVDPTGEVAETIWDLFNIGLGVQSYRENRAAGNNVAAAVDAVGIALDSLSAAVPIIPGGAGSAIRGARGADAAVEAAKNAGEGKIAVIGRLPDTEVAREWEGHEVLNIPDWNIQKNDEWVSGVIENRQTVYTASPIEGNIWDDIKGRETVYGRELGQFEKAGYTRDGDYLRPPQK